MEIKVNSKENPRLFKAIPRTFQGYSTQIKGFPKDAKAVPDCQARRQRSAVIATPGSKPGEKRSRGTSGAPHVLLDRHAAKARLTKTGVSRRPMAAHETAHSSRLRPERHAELGVRLQARPADEVDAIGHGGEHRVEAGADRGRLARQVDDEALAPRSATWRDRMAVGTSARLFERINSPNPGSNRSQTASVASGVTSRGAGPVPPVVRISGQRRRQPTRSAPPRSPAARRARAAAPAATGRPEDRRAPLRCLGRPCPRTRLARPGRIW